jgi:hypothetical protein
VECLVIESGSLDFERHFTAPDAVGEVDADEASAGVVAGGDVGERVEEAGVACDIVEEGIDLGLNRGNASAEANGGRDFWKRVLHCIKVVFI